MATSAVEPEHNRAAAGGTDRPHHSSKQQHRRRLLSHLHVQVPIPASSAGWSGRPSGPASAPPCDDAHANNAAAHHHQDHRRPASPSLLRSPTAWIRWKGHSFGSSNKHTPRRPGNFHYDARSYAQNFDEGGREEGAHRYLSPSSQGTGGGEEPARETLGV